MRTRMSRSHPMYGIKIVDPSPGGVRGRGQKFEDGSVLYPTGKVKDAETKKLRPAIGRRKK